MKQVLNVTCVELARPKWIFIGGNSQVDRVDEEKILDDFASSLTRQIRPNTTELQVRCDNPFDNLPSLIRFFEFCPKVKPVISLDLSKADLTKQFAPVITKLISLIPPAVTSLNLSLPQPGEDFLRTLKLICSSLPNTMKTLNLSGHYGADDLLMLKEGCVILSDDEVVNMSDEQRQVLVDILSQHFNQLHFVDKQGEVLSSRDSRAMKLIEPLFRAAQDELLFGKNP